MARISPTLAAVINKFIPPSSNESVGLSEKVQEQQSNKSTTTVEIQEHVVNGKLVLRLTGSPACNHDTVTRLVSWMNYHILDEEFEKNCRFDHFDQSEFHLQQQRLNELPCFFDWNFITQLGGGETLSPHKRTDFYNLVILADQLGLNSLVVLAGKYICSNIQKKSVEEVRNILGLINDLSEEEEKQIRKTNEAILRSQF